MKEDLGGVIEIGLGVVDTFVNLCTAKGCQHTKIQEDSRGAVTVDIGQLEQALEFMESKIQLYQ